MSEKTTMFLRCEFTEDQMKEFSKELARQASNLNESEEQKKAAVAQFADQIASAKSLVSSLARKVNQGYEMKDVKCEIFFDVPELGMVRVVRLDTGEVVKDRPMTESEKQRSLPLEGGIQESER